MRHCLPEAVDMKAKQIFEDAHHTICIYPGRFQPPHRGHAATYRLLEKKYGQENTFIATSNKTDGDKSPFDFAEKKALLIAAGVPAERIVQVVNTYNATEITSQYDLSHTVVLYAVGEKDMGTDPRFSNFVKKDGTPTYLQPMIPEPETADNHAYLIIAPTVEFKMNGKPITSASEIRQMFKDADPAERADIVHQLYGMDTASVLKIFEKKLMPDHPVQDYINTKNPVKPAKKKNKKQELELPENYTMEQFDRILNNIILEAYSKAEPEKEPVHPGSKIDPDTLIDPDLGAVPARKPVSKQSNSNDELEKELQKRIGENFKDGRHPEHKGDSQRHGIPKGATMAQDKRLSIPEVDLHYDPKFKLSTHMYDKGYGVTPPTQWSDVGKDMVINPDKPTIIVPGGKKQIAPGIKGMLKQQGRQQYDPGTYKDYHRTAYSQEDPDDIDTDDTEMIQEPVDENFADGKGPGRPGDSQRHGIPKHASVSTLRKIAKQGGRKGQLAHWQANMKAGKKKANEETIYNWAAVPNKPVPAAPVDMRGVKIQSVLKKLHETDQQLMDEGIFDAIGRGLYGAGAVDSGAEALDAIKQGDWQTALGAGLEAGGSALGMLPKFSLPTALGGVALSALGSAIKPAPKYQNGLPVPDHTQAGTKTAGRAPVDVPNPPIIRDPGAGSAAPNTTPDSSTSPNLSTNKPKPAVKKPRAPIAS